jgi:hypothetical protein
MTLSESNTRSCVIADEIEHGERSPEAADTKFALVA